MAGFFEQEFPYIIVGDYGTAKEAEAAGWSINQIWSVAHCGTVTSYGPAHHTLGIEKYVVTNERHDGDTYYEEGDDD